MQNSAPAWCSLGFKTHKEHMADLAAFDPAVPIGVKNTPKGSCDMKCW